MDALLWLDPSEYQALVEISHTPSLWTEGMATGIGAGAFEESAYQYLQGLGACTFLVSGLVDWVLLCCKWACHLDKVDFLL